jgi:aldose 1-epimerase
MNAVQREELTLQLDGALVQEYTLKNANAQIKISSFGATLLSFTIQCPGFPSRDVVLGYKDFESYRKAFEQSGNAYFGAIVGPIAGRISNAKIPWKAGVFEFEPNEGKHLLHSGNKCFSNSNWELVSLQEKPYPSVTLALETKASGIALPGNLRCEATYCLKDFTLELHIESIALEDTLANPTQHSYFNPNGHQASVLNSEAWIAADSFLNLNQEKLPTGGLFPLFVDSSSPSSSHSSSSSSTPFFSLQTMFEGLDHAFLLNAKEAQAKLVAADGYELRFDTNQPVIQVYVGGAVAFEGKEGAKYHRHSGICLEQQAEPDAPNQLNFSDIYLQKGQSKTNTMRINFEQSK